MCRSSRAIIFRFHSKTRWQMFLLLYGRHVCVPQKNTKNGVYIQSSLNLGDTLLQITREWKTAEAWFLARLFIHQSSIVSEILDFIHWMVTIFNFITSLVRIFWRPFKYNNYPTCGCWVWDDYLIASSAQRASLAIYHLFLKTVSLDNAIREFPLA